MPEKKTIEKAEQDLQEGKAPTTAAGEFVHEEMEHIKKGKHGAKSRKQAVAIGLSKARRAGVPLKPPKKGQAKKKTRRSAERDSEAGQGQRKTTTRSRKSSQSASRSSSRAKPSRSRSPRSSASTSSSRTTSRRGKTTQKRGSGRSRTSR